eukprot:1586658-Prymnesium_polylepis.1
MECVGMIIEVLFVDARPQHESPLDLSRLPAGCHHLARRELLEWLAHDRGWCNLLVQWVKDYWACQTVDHKFWNLRVSSLVHQITTGPPRVAFGVSPVEKQLDDKLRVLRQIARDSDFPHHQQHGAVRRKMLPGDILREGFSRETQGSDGMLSDALRRQID